MSGRMSAGPVDRPLRLSTKLVIDACVGLISIRLAAADGRKAAHRRVMTSHDPAPLVGPTSARHAGLTGTPGWDALRAELPRDVVEEARRRQRPSGDALDCRACGLARAA